MSSVANVERLPRVPGVGRVTQTRVAVSEWTKLWSVRSTRWSLFAAFLFTIGVAALACAVVSHHYPQMSPQDKASFHPLEVNLAGVQLAQLALGVLGVLIITAEYSTGMIRASFTAVPKRLPVLWAKAGVFAFVTFALMLPAVLVAFFVGQAILAGHNIDVGFTAPHVIRVLVGAALYLTVVGLFGLAIMFVLPPLMNVLPTSWNNAASPYLPLQAGEAILSTTPGGHLSPWVGLALFAGYAAAAIAVAAVLLVRRDT
jgi:hypothetical protein